MRVFMKILLIVGLFSSIYANNLDQKKFYDANRDNNEKLEKMAQELQLFIDSTASDELIKEYKEAEVELTEEEKEAELEAQREAAIAAGEAIPDEAQQEPGFFASMLEKVGIGSTKKLPVENNETSEVAPETTEQEATPSEEAPAQEAPAEQEVQDEVKETQEEPKKEESFFGSLLEKTGLTSKEEVTVTEDAAPASQSQEPQTQEVNNEE